MGLQNSFIDYQEPLSVDLSHIYRSRHLPTLCRVVDPSKYALSSCNAFEVHQLVDAARRRFPSIIEHGFRLYDLGTGLYCCRGITIGRRRDRAKASAASRDIVSVRIALPIDMKHLKRYNQLWSQATAHYSSSPKSSTGTKHILS